VGQCQIELHIVLPILDTQPSVNVTVIRQLAVNRITAILVLAIPLLSCGGVQLSVNDSEKYRNAIESGNEIVHALEAHKLDTGYYPKTLKALSPKYIKVMPKAGIYENEFYYNNIREMSKKNGLPYKGPNEYTLSFSIDKPGFMDLAARSMTRFVYRPAKNYGSDNEEVYFLTSGWAYVTSYRYKVGESGRVE